MIINDIPLNPAALEAAARALVGITFSADAGVEELKDSRWRAFEDDARAAVSAYLAERSHLLSGPRFSTDELRNLRGIVESGTPLARNTVLRLIESAFVEVTK